MLKQQYAVGDIDDVEFERRLETLLESETVDDVENRLDINSVSTNEDERVPAPVKRKSPRHGCHRGGKHRHGRH
ncbi:hypothetical protein [Haladaptatus sp. NG-WS-4]